MNEIITSRNNPKIKEAASYIGGKGDYFLVEGFHMVEMALLHESVLAIFSLKPYTDKVKNYLVNESVLDKLTSSKTPEGIVALCKKKDEKSLSSARVLILDGVADPGNVGTLCRSALAFGFNDIILGERCASIYNEKTLMASQGAVFALNLVKTNDLVSYIKKLRKEEYKIFGTSLSSSYPLSEAHKNVSKMAIILGNEGKGVRKEVLAETDCNLRIEMENIDSLNVAMAGSILMYEYRLLSK